MNYFSKSRSSRLDFENINSKEFTTVCSWLRDIHGQNIRLINQNKLLIDYIITQSSSPLGEPSPENDSRDLD